MVNRLNGVQFTQEREFLRLNDAASGPGQTVWKY